MKIHSALLYLTLLATNFSTYAKDFKQNIFDPPGEVVGCPLFSSCSKSTGEVNIKWKKVLHGKYKNKEKFINQIKTFKKRYGIPLDIWSKSDSPNTGKVIFWNSKCSNHNIKDKYVFAGTVFIKKFGEITNKDHIVNLTYMLDSNNKIIKYKIPRALIPSFINGNKLSFIIESYSKYFNIEVDKRGNIKVMPSESSLHLPINTSCPDVLIKKFTRKKNNINLYRSHFCKSVWDKKEKIYKTFIFGWSCE